MPAKIIVRLIRDYDGPDLIQQTPGRTGIWQGIHFTMQPVPECDYLIVLRSQMKNPIDVFCPPEHVWALVQDPFVAGFNDWLVEGYEKFSRVFTQVFPARDEKFIRSQPALPWYVKRTYEELLQLPVPVKIRELSWIAGGQLDIPGHFQRRLFRRHLEKEQGLKLDIFGCPGIFLEDKADGLLPYRYSLAIENSSIPDYWTEKIADCFLCWTVPIYWGCPNLEDYFPSESFIRIDLNRPRKAISIIKDILKDDEWQRRLPALQEARHLILNKYQLFPHFADIIKKEPPAMLTKKEIHIPVYSRSRHARISRLAYKLRRIFWHISAAFC